MVIPITGIVLLFGAFVYIYLTRKFWQCYKAENNYIARLFSFSFLSRGMYYLVAGIPCLLLIEDQEVWRVVAPIYVFFVETGWSLLGYAVIGKVKFPKYSRIIGVLFSILIIIAVGSNIIHPSRYFFINGSLDWEIEFKHALLGFLITSGIALPSAIIFFQQARGTKDKRAKIRSLGFGLALSLLSIEMFVEFFLITVFDLSSIYANIDHLIVSSLLAITLIRTWGPPKSKWVKKIG